MTGYHTRWVRPPEEAEDPERVAIREALAFGKAVYDQRRTLGLSVTDLAERAGMPADEIECIEEGGTEPTIALLRRLAAGLGRRCAPDCRTRPRIGVVRTPRSLTVKHWYWPPAAALTDCDARCGHGGNISDMADNLLAAMAVRRHAEPGGLCPSTP